MKIVIDINENIYKYLKQEWVKVPEDDSVINQIMYGILNGAVLPNRYGDLIDRDKLEKDTEWDEYEDGFISYSHGQIFSEPIVIPADKGE